MEQETGIGALYDEFFQGYRAEINLFSIAFLSDWTYKRAYALGLFPTVHAHARVRFAGGSSSGDHRRETESETYLP